MKAPTKQAAFLAVFSIVGRIGPAARAAKIARTTHYVWMQDPAYESKFREAMRHAVDAWEDECIKRAVEGTFEPLKHKGDFVFPVIGFELDADGKPDPCRPIYRKTPRGIWKKSDRLLEFLLKANKPEVYRERSAKEVAKKSDWKFEGSMEELIATYRDLVAKGAKDSS